MTIHFESNEEFLKMLAKATSLLIGAFILGAVTACAPASETVETDAMNAQTSATSATSTTASETQTKNPLLGRWVVQSEADDFEPWVFFDESKYYGDGNEEGAPYELQEDHIIYSPEYGEYANKVIELTAERFVEETEDGIRTVWTKADL